MRLVLLALLCLLPLAPARAAETKHFDSASLETIRSARPGRPFALVLWSLDCSHCREEMKLLARAKRRHPRLDLVFVSTDGPDAAAEVARTLATAGLGSAESWVFGAEAPEKLRWSIDRKWRGELPRTYLYDAAHQATGISGRLPRERLSAWLEEAKRFRR
ncbi:MAG: TlpA family protein disulfide reductase [Pseudomonadota bacterium]|jgi:thiol-disulfide isomerase/thioredoxin